MLGSHAGSYLALWIVLFGLAYHGSGQTNSACFEQTRRNDFKRLGRSCFWASSITGRLRSRSDAQSVCEDFGGSLASVATIEILDFLNTNWNINSGYYYWIGLYRDIEYVGSSPDTDTRRQSAYWKWLTGTAYDQYNDLGWKEDEPWHDGRFGMLYQSKWTAASSEDYKAPFICETELPGNIQTDDGPTEENSPPSDVRFHTQPDLDSEQKCQGNWVYNNTIHKCYSLLESIPKLKQEEAQTKCRQVGGDLACPSTEQKHQAVIKLIRQANKYNEDVWIGLKKVIQSEGGLSQRRSNWVWLDASPYSDFQVWDENEPGGGERFARIQNGKWKGINIAAKYRFFLCQKDISNISNDIPAPPPNPPASPTSTSASSDTQNDMPPMSGPNNPRQEHGGSDKGIKDTPGKKESNTAGLLGPIIGVVAALVLAAVIIAVVMKRRGSGRFNSFMNLLPFKKKENEYAEAVDHTYHNDEVNPTTSVSQQNVAVVSDNSPKLKSPNRFVQKDNPVTTPEPHVRNPLHIYATVKKPFKPAIPAKAAAKPIKDKPYATLNLKKLLMPKPKLEKASSLEQLNMRSGPNGAYENTMFSSAVRVEELNDWVKQATASHAIEEQYKSVQQSAPNEQKIYCNKVEFKLKNRYKNLVPYDSNRVELSQLNGDPYSHYINASYVDSYSQKKAFIAAQGPTSNTVNDFWRMIWEKSVKVIVTVSNQTEPDTGKLNFVQYWPKGKEIESFGDLSVTLKKVENLPDYIVRHMAVSKRADIQIVKQYLFKSWRDHNVPKHAMALINYHEKIRKEMSKGKDPVLVHCSAGVGRTGTYIAIDYLLEQAKKEGVVDFLLCLKKLRQQRTDMVQKLIQYQFLIRAVLEALTLGKTAITCSDFAKSVQLFRDPVSDGVTRMQKQFEMLAHYFTEEQRSHDAAKLPENINKNRDKNVLPISSKRVLLMTPVSEKNDYINAVFVDGHRRKSAYIATHAPLEHTVVDFWRAVFDYNSNVIVMLCPKYYMKTDEAYFPEGLGDKTDVAPFEIECVEEDDHNGVRRKQLSLKYCGLERYICHFSITEDLSAMSTQEKMTTLYYIYENAKKWQQQQPEKKAPVTVHCLEGTEWTGLYCTLSNLFDQMNEEQEVDVFHAAGQLRLARTQFIPTMKQYEMIYDILSLYIDQFNMYSNFQ